MAQNRARNTPKDWVELQLDGIEGTQVVAPIAVDYWKSRGWTEVADEQPPAAAANPAAEQAVAQDAPAVKTSARRAGSEN